ncbi:MAG: LLM class flavin-dependent oxidoreductase [Actinobacteria bacterium]|nr:LLM class flavin-dependent oxidoreductase [Actinomycetota bacterium]
MRYGLCLANIGSYSDARAVAEFAAEAEVAGWESLFVWDHLAFVWGMPSADPWVVLTACAMRTSRLLLGTAVTPVPRRRVQNLAHTVGTLDQLSGGRVVFGAGLGGNRGEFERFGEDFSRARRLELLDEGLAVLRQWWDGEEVDGIALRPPPTGRVPIWVGGNSAEALVRAARYDGWIADSTDPERMKLSPAQIAEKSRGLPGELAVMGYSDRAEPGAYEDAGATWWLESLHDRRGTSEENLAVVQAGPPA